MRKKTLFIIIFLCVLSLCYCLFNIIKIISDYQVSEKEYTELSNTYTKTEKQISEIISDNVVEKNEEKIIEKNNDIQINVNANNNKEILEKKIIDWEALINKNNEIYAWIYIEDTIIDYPIVQSKDNSKYLKTTFEGKNASAGTLFVDYRNCSDFNNYNTIIYGHNMKNGSMFCEIKKYINQNYYDEHKIINIYTKEAEYKYKIISAYKTTATSNSYNIYFDETEYFNWLNEIKQKSLIKCEEINEEKNVLTLSTCCGATGSLDRIVVHLQQEE